MLAMRKSALTLRKARGQESEGVSRTTYDLQIRLLDWIGEYD